MLDKTKIDILTEKLYKAGNIAPELYKRYNVKRGLRNEDGSGVVVGLTQIGEVHAYVMSEGEKIPVDGLLTYWGYDVQELVDGFRSEGRHGFEECAYLLLFGVLPSAEELREFNGLLAEQRVLPEGFNRDMIMRVPSTDIMNALARSILALYSYDPKAEDNSIGNTLAQSISLIAKTPVIATAAYQTLCHYHKNESLYLHNTRPDLGTAENVLHMLRPDSKYTQNEADILDLILVLHAEHGGGNNSTFTTHVVTSTGTDIYSCMAAAIGSLKGPKHGGANNVVMDMIEEFKQNVRDWKDEDEITAYIDKIFNKEAFDHSGLLYGMGHAVYTLSDPRAVILKHQAAILAEEKGMQEEFDFYKAIERLGVEAFKKLKNTEKIICANVDFYSGFVYKMLNLPVELYTPLFASARMAGWAAHRIEELMSGGKIIRPAYKNVIDKRDYVCITDRA